MVLCLCSFVKFVLRLESQRSDFADFSVFIELSISVLLFRDAQFNLYPLLVYPLKFWTNRSTISSGVAHDVMNLTAECSSSTILHTKHP